MNTLLLAFPAASAAFLAGLGIGLFNRCLDRRRPRAAGPFDIDWKPATACDLTFDCPRWRQSEGECCPDGTVRHDCPGLFL